MGVRVENYLIMGFKFDEDFTKNYWKMDFRDDTEWNSKKPSDKPFFITDGMDGDYTYFGYIMELANGWDYPVTTEINLDFNKNLIVDDFAKLYPNIHINIEDVKLYFLVHYV